MSIKVAKLYSNAATTVVRLSAYRSWDLRTPASPSLVLIIRMQFFSFFQNEQLFRTLFYHYAHYARTFIILHVGAYKQEGHSFSTRHSVRGAQQVLLLEKRIGPF